MLWTETLNLEKRGLRLLGLIGWNVVSVPEPHPLDFDWRFDECTVIELSKILPHSRPILAVGCPSIARHLQRTARKVILVDRQPFQCVRDQIEADIDYGAPLVRGCNYAIVDPPWYPDQFSQWTAWAANCVGDGGTVFASIWPGETRPSAERELKAALEWIESWATVVQHGYSPKYEMPLFELIAQQSSQSGKLANSPRSGMLIEIKVKALPPVPLTPSKSQNWLRLILNDYQIALQMREDWRSPPSLLQIPGANGRLWPFVSRRAPERYLIDLWSSRNEVGEVQGVELLAGVMRTLIQTKTRTEFEAALAPFPALLEWQIPRPPYWRTHEWLHHR